MIWALIAVANPIRVAFLGTAKMAPSLSSMLGPGYQVEVETNLSDVERFHPSFVIANPVSDQPPTSLDRFVPELKKTLFAITSLPDHPKVLMMTPPSNSDMDRQILRPLAIQRSEEHTSELQSPA